MKTDDRVAKTERVALRASSQQRAILDEASRAEHTTLSDFVLRYAVEAAEQVLADRRVFVLSHERWIQFIDALDQPERDLPGIRKLLETAEE